jgi:AcrR family transcriptional regulator
VAKPGTASRVGAAATSDGTPTRQALIEAARTTLSGKGFGGASARAIAAEAGVNQALVFYHFGSVTSLLLAALDETSRQRMHEYSSAVESAGSLPELVDAAASVFNLDLAGGHISVLAEMIAGASSVPGLGPEVAARMTPWIDFAEATIHKAMDMSPLASLVPASDAAYAIVALYLGIEMLAHLDGDRARADSLFATARQLVGLVTALAAGTP